MPYDWDEFDEQADREARATRRASSSAFRLRTFRKPQCSIDKNFTQDEKLIEKLNVIDGKVTQ